MAFASVFGSGGSKPAGPPGTSAPPSTGSGLFKAPSGGPGGPGGPKPFGAGGPPSVSVGVKSSSGGAGIFDKPPVAASPAGLKFGGGAGSAFSSATSVPASGAGPSAGGLKKFFSGKPAADVPPSPAVAVASGGFAGSAFASSAASGTGAGGRGGRGGGGGGTESSFGGRGARGGKDARPRDDSTTTTTTGDALPQQGRRGQPTGAHSDPATTGAAASPRGGRGGTPSGSPRGGRGRGTFGDGPSTPSGGRGGGRGGGAFVAQPRSQRDGGTPQTPFASTPVGGAAPPSLLQTPMAAPASAPTPRLPPVANPTEFDKHIDAKIFGLLVKNVLDSRWADAIAVVNKFCTSHGGAEKLSGTLPAFVRCVDAAAPSAKQKSLAAATLTKGFAVAMCMLVRATFLETRAVDRRVDTWRTELAEAHDCACIALRAFTDITSAVSHLPGAPADRAHVFGMLPPILTQYRRLTMRCVAAGVTVDIGAAKGQCKAYFRDAQKTAGGALPCSGCPRPLAVAAARIVGELVIADGMSAGNDWVGLAKWFNDEFPDEEETRIIVSYRVGEAALAKLRAADAVTLLSIALVVSPTADNESRASIMESLVAAKLLTGEVPEPEVFEHFPMPELEDVAVALRTANLAMFDRSLTANAKWLLARNLLLPVSVVRSQVLLQMLVRFNIEACGNTFRVDLTQMRAYYSGQLDDGFDVKQSLVTPFLLQGFVIGYVSGDTLVLSKRNPFPGLPLEKLAASMSMSPSMAGTPAFAPPVPAAMPTPQVTEQVPKAAPSTFSTPFAKPAKMGPSSDAIAAAAAAFAMAT